MKKAFKTLCSVLIICAFVVSCGVTNAIYFSSVSMLGELDFIKRVGSVLLFHPEYVWGYDTVTGYFKVPQIPTNYPHIHYEISNKFNDVINEEEFEYYIRIVNEDGGTTLPIEYDVHNYSATAETEIVVEPLKENVGYGPFIMSAGVETLRQFSIKANWTAATKEETENPRQLRVQIVREQAGGILRVINEAPLNMKYTGEPIQDNNATITFNYSCGGNNLSYQQIAIKKGSFINFKDSTNLASYGIQIPSGYEFSYATCGTLDPTWAGHDNFTIPEDGDDSYYINVVLAEVGQISITLNYTCGDAQLGNQSIFVKEGDVINFKDSANLASHGIQIPSGYTFSTATCGTLDPTWAGHDSFTIPTGGDNNYYINVILTK